MKTKTFFKNALVLTACSLLISGGGMLLRVFQTGWIGAEGMGLLQLLFSVYYFTTNLAVSGLNLAVTRLVSESLAQNGASVHAIVQRCFGLCVCTGIGAGALLFFGAPWFGADLLGDARTVPALRILSFGLPLFSVSCCCRGYFLAVRNSLKPCLGQLTEQLCSFAAIALLLPQAAPHGLAAACGTIALGMTIGELCGNIPAVLFLLRDLRRYPTLQKTDAAVPLHTVFGISAPIALGYYLRSALIAVENVLIPAGLKRCGSSYTASLSAYGVVKGIAFPTIQFPSAFLTAFSLLLIPEVAQFRTVGHPQEIKRMAQRVFRVCLHFSLFVVVVFLCFGDMLGILLYHNNSVGTMLRVLCPLIPFMYLDSIVDAMLKGLNEQVYALKVNMSESCIRIMLMLFLLPKFGLSGYLLAMYISVLYNATLSIGRLVNKSRMKIDWYSWVLCPSVCAFFSCLGGQLLTDFCTALGFSAAIALFLAITAAAGGYLFLLRIFTPSSRPAPQSIA